MPNNDEKKVLLKVTDLKQWFPLKKTKLFQKEQEYVRANDGITLNIYEGETVGLVGEPDVENQHLEELYFRSTNRQKVRQCITAELLPIWHRFM